jgi:hypothetical protein
VENRLALGNLQLLPFINLRKSGEMFARQTKKIAL